MRVKQFKQLEGLRKRRRMMLKFWKRPHRIRRQGQAMAIAFILKEFVFITGNTIFCFMSEPTVKKQSVIEISLMEIPDELFIDLIFQFVGTKKELLNLHYVCKRFYNILQTEYLFKKLCLSTWKECFVLHLPDTMFSKYYDSLYRKMFFLDNKYRFSHYGITYEQPLNTPKEIREYDRKNGTDIENQLLQGICLDLYYKDFYAGEEKFKTEENKTLTLEMVFDEDNFDEFTVQDPFVNIFCSLHNPNDPEDKTIDPRFPKYYMVYHYPGDNISGYIYEENSKKPVMGNGDCNLFDYNYESRSTNYDEKKKNVFLQPLYDSFLKIYEAYIEHREGQDDTKNEEGKMGIYLEYLKELNKDRLTYSNTPIFKVVNSPSGKPILIIHTVDDSRRWSNRGTMGGIQRNMGDLAKKDYENKSNGRLMSGDCVFTHYPEKNLYVCSVVCILMQNKKRIFSQYHWRWEGVEKIKEFCKNKGIEEVHFDSPKKDVLKDYKNYKVRKELNKMVNRDKYKVVFHDRDYQGSVDIYEDITKI